MSPIEFLRGSFIRGSTVLSIVRSQIRHSYSTVEEYDHEKLQSHFSSELYNVAISVAILNIYHVGASL